MQLILYIVLSPSSRKKNPHRESSSKEDCITNQNAKASKLCFFFAIGQIMNSIEI